MICGAKARLYALEGDNDIAGGSVSVRSGREIETFEKATVGESLSS